MRYLTHSLLFTLVFSSPSVFASQSTSENSTTDDTTPIERIFVTGQSYDLRQDDASSATLVSAPLKEIPLNIGVIPKGVLELENASDIRDVIEQNGSVITGTGHTRSFSRIFIRGFRADGETNSTLKNGIPFYGVDSPAADPSALQSVEVLKGAAGLLFGAAQPGGVINYVYRAPQAQSSHSARLTLGSFNTKRLDLDSTGALNSNDLTYRFSLGYENSDSWQDYNYVEKLAPTFQISSQLTDNTKVHLLAEQIRVDNNPSNVDTVVDSNNQIVKLPDNTYLGHSNDYSEETSKQLQAKLEHSFTASLNLTAQVGLNSTKRDQGATGYLQTNGSPEAMRNVERRVFDQRRTSDGEYFAVHLNYDNYFGDWRHRGLIGINGSSNNMNNQNAFSILVPEQYQSPISKINIYDPITTEYPHLTQFNSTPPFAILDWTYRDKGINLQDLITYEPWHLHILMGLRYGDFSTEFNSRTNWQGEQIPLSFNSPDNSAWIPRLGVVWEASNSWSIYTSYGESFNSPFTTALNPNNEPITEPENGEQIEVGARFLLLDERLSLTLAAFEIDKFNVIVPTDTPNVSVVDGKQSSRGFEFDAAGEVSNSLDIYLSYAYTDTEVKDSGFGAKNEGNRFAGIPLHKLVLWSQWQFAENWSLAYSIDYQSDTPGDTANTFYYEDRTIHELQIRSNWQFDNMDVVVDFGIENLTDVHYYQNNTSATFIKRASPRAAFASVSMKF